MRKPVISFVLCLTLSAGVFGASKISPDLQGVDPNSNVRVIVQYNQATPVSSQGGLLGGVLGLVGGVLNSVLGIVNAVVSTVPASSLQTLASNPNVTYISPDRVVAGRLDYSSAAVNAGAAWRSFLNGTGIGVAVVDSGIDATPDLKLLGLLPRVVYTQDFTGGNGADQYGHGTHVAGIIGANGAASRCFNCTRSFVGIAPNSSLINLRVLDGNGQGSDSYVIQAIETAINLKRTYNIRVLNLSLGRPIYESYTQDPLCQAVEAAWKAGIVVVAAAGNDGRDNSVGNNGYGTIESPGNDPYVITVGAMKAMGTYSRTDDLIASYSSKGPSALDHVVKPDIVAPGNHVVSLLAPGSTLAANATNAVPLSYYQTTSSTAMSSSYLMLNGTSMATPVVSGAVADILQGNPWLTPDQVKARLMKTAYKTFPISSTAVDPVTGQTFVSQYDIFTIGAGYLDIAAALANNELATGTAMSPIASYDGPSGNVYLAFDPSSVWSAAPTSAWGAQSVWGTIPVNADLSLWGNQAVWGTSSVSGFQSIWSTNTVWGFAGVSGATTPTANNTVWGFAGTSASNTVWGFTASTSDSDTIFTVQH